VATVQGEAEIRGLDPDDGLHDLDALKEVVAPLQAPTHSLDDLEAILERPELEITRMQRPSHWGP